MSLKRSTRPETRIKYLDQEQVTRLFQAARSCPSRDQLILAFMYRFAMRTREVCDLPREAVDVRRMEVTIQGAKNGLCRTYTTPKDLKRLVSVYRPSLGQPYYFTGRQGQLHRVRVWKIFKDIAGLAGITGVGAHSLRHAAVVHLLDAGLGIEEARDLARHRKTSSADVYANLSVRRRSDYLQRLQDSPAIVKLR